MDANPQIIMETDKGNITIELYPDKTPETAANFLRAVDEAFYNGTIFHRVIKGFMVQGGGLGEDMDEKDWNHKPVKNEAADGISNERGTIAMARTMDPNSATTQFFINTVDNARLDHSAPTPSGFGYCAFGRVIAGMDAVDAIEGTETTSRRMHDDVPVEPVVIRSVRRAS